MGPPGVKLLSSALIATTATLTASSVWSQEVRDYGTTTRGRAQDQSHVTTAQLAVSRAGADCEVTAARMRGRDVSGDPQYEVACRSGPGYIVLTGSMNQALSCLAIDSQNTRDGRSGARLPACELPANQDTLSHYQRMGREAGVACRIDEGAMVGLTPGGAEIYEIGCSDLSGAWIERAGRHWSLKDCLTVSSEGSACRFTSEDETLASFRDRLHGGALSGCDPRSVRGMGANASGAFYEIVCRDDRHVVGRFEAAKVAEVIPCEAATRIGDGCRLRP